MKNDSSRVQENDSALSNCTFSWLLRQFQLQLLQFQLQFASLDRQVSFFQVILSDFTFAFAR